MNNTIKIIVDSITGSTDSGYSKVFLNKQTFLTICGTRPQVAPTETEWQVGHNLSTFVIDGITIYSDYDKTSKTSSFVMKTEDAQKCLASRINLPFNQAIFAQNIVATA